MNELAIAIAVGVVAAAGLYLALARDAVSIVLGLALLGSAANFFVFAAGRLPSALPAILPPEGTVPAAALANPVPQALVLTAIVIGFALACLGIALALALEGERGEPGEPP